MRKKEKINFWRVCMSWAGKGAAVLVFFLMNTEIIIPAQELGGFQIEMGTGENSELPSEWNEEFGSTEAQEENWNEESENNDIQEEIQNEDIVSVQENIFGSGEVYSGECVSEENTNSPGQTVCAEADQMITSDPVITPTPIITYAPTVSPTPAVNSESQVLINPFSFKSLEASGAPGMNQKFIPSEKIPEVTYWKGETDSRLCLNIAAEGEVQILYLKMNGKEVSWNWQGSRIITAQEENTDGEKKVQTEIAVLTYSGNVHGIFIDGKNKS